MGGFGFGKDKNDNRPAICKLDNKTQIWSYSFNVNISHSSTLIITSMLITKNFVAIGGMFLGSTNSLAFCIDDYIENLNLARVVPSKKIIIKNFPKITSSKNIVIMAIAGAVSAFIIIMILIAYYFYRKEKKIQQLSK